MHLATAGGLILALAELALVQSVAAGGVASSQWPARASRTISTKLATAGGARMLFIIQLIAGVRLLAFATVTAGAIVLARPERRSSKP